MGCIGRSWLGGRKEGRGAADPLSSQLEAHWAAMDALVSALQSFQDCGNTSVGAAAASLSRASLRDHIMVARHGGGLHQGPFDLLFDVDPVLCGRHSDWHGDALLTAVTFLDDRCKVFVPSTGEGTCTVQAEAGRTLLYWSAGAASHTVLGCGGPEPLGPESASLCILLRYFDGRKSLLSPPGSTSTATATPYSQCIGCGRWR